MSRARTSTILVALGLSLLVVGAILAGAGVHARRSEAGLVAGAERTVMRERFRQEPGA